jgi:hypothetical protein
MERIEEIRLVGGFARKFLITGTGVKSRSLAILSEH